LYLVSISSSNILLDVGPDKHGLILQKILQPCGVSVQAATTLALLEISAQIQMPK